MYHEKVGIVTDAEGNKIVFTGSLNETINAFYNNYESIVVFTSWEESRQYAEEMQNDFDTLWNNEDTDLEIIEFPEVVKEKIKLNQKPKINYDIDEEEMVEESPVQKGVPRMPSESNLHGMQGTRLHTGNRRICHGKYGQDSGRD